MLPHRGDVERAVQAQGPGERSPPLRESDALRVGVHGGAAARQATVRIGDEDAPGRDDAQQGGLGRSCPAADASALRARVAGRLGV